MIFLASLLVFFSRALVSLTACGRRIQVQIIFRAMSSWVAHAIQPRKHHHLLLLSSHQPSFSFSSFCASVSEMREERYQSARNAGGSWIKSFFVRCLPGLRVQSNHVSLAPIIFSFSSFSSLFFMHHSVREEGGCWIRSFLCDVFLAGACDSTT